jgi:hypothetical protein
MKPSARKLLPILAALWLSSSFAAPSMAAVDSELLEILLQNGAITKDQYETPKSREEARTEAERERAEEEIKAAVKENMPSWVDRFTPHADFRPRWDWQLFSTYSRLEEDAQFDEFPDSDFYSGGTNSKGWTPGYKIGSGRHWEHDLKHYNTKEITGSKSDEQRIHADLKYIF